MSALPDLMHATQVVRPFHTQGWVYEEKYDGWRMLARKDTGGVQLISRNGRDHTKRFHAIAEALAALKPETFTLDGEVAVFDAELVSRFEWLRHINHGDLSTPPLFKLGEKDYRPEPLKVRRKALELPGEGMGLGVKLVVDRQPTSRLSSRNTLTTPSGSIYTKHGGRV